jgi:hypothetical protein
LRVAPTPQSSCFRYQKMVPMRRSRRDFLTLLTLTTAGLAATGLAACTQTGVTNDTVSSAESEPSTPDATPRPADELASAADRPTAGPTPAPTAETTPRPDQKVVVPATSTPLPATPVPNATPRPRPVHALLNVSYYSQHIGRMNYCLPTSIAMIADRYDRLPPEVAGTRDRAPRYVADVSYRQAREQVAALDEKGFHELWELIGTDPLGEQIWNVFAPNGRDLAVGMSPALAYLVLVYAFGLDPVLGTLDQCIAALGEDIPSILFGSYAPLRRADGLPPNVGGFNGDHAFVLVGIDRERLLINDPLPSDKVLFSGRGDPRTAGQRAVTFDLASVRQMTRGDKGKPRGDLFMIPPPGVDYDP